ncbi:Uncharacterised protein [Nocardia brasiliensis]|nr:Uncharacterised protein [Nocardia brasiliensis]
MAVPSGTGRRRAVADRDWPSALIARAQRRGGIMRVRVPMPGRAWLVADGALIDRVLRTGAVEFDKGGPIYRIIRKATGDEGLFAVDDPRVWRELREQTNPGRRSPPIAFAHHVFRRGAGSTSVVPAHLPPRRRRHHTGRQAAAPRRPAVPRPRPRRPPLRRRQKEMRRRAAGPAHRHPRPRRPRPALPALAPCPPAQQPGPLRHHRPAPGQRNPLLRVNSARPLVVTTYLGVRVGR